MQAATGEQQLAGTGNFYIDLTTSGEEKKELTKNINGKIQAAITNGSIRNKKLTTVFQKAQKLLSHHISSKEKSQFSFSAINATATINNGIAKPKGKLTSENLLITANGTVDPTQQLLNITLKTQYINSTKTRDYTLPIYIRGDITSPTMKLDSNNLLKQIASKNSNELLKKASKHLDNIDLSKLFGH